MCIAYAETGLLDLMYHVCSLCLIAIDLPDCPVLHMSCCKCYTGILYPATVCVGLGYFVNELLMYNVLGM
jgi:hypothetical protein